MTKNSIYNDVHDTFDLPDLVTGSKPVSYFEFWPIWLFYLPMKIYGVGLALRYGGLTLPTITDPLFDVGGFVCESKAQILDQIPEEISDKFCTHIAFQKTGDSEEAMAEDHRKALQLMKEKSISYPCVVKPDIGERGMGVQILYKDSDLKGYMHSFPTGENIVVQEMADYPCEVGLFYIRHPDQEKGQIFSLTIKYFPHVTGDGQSTLKELILSDKRAGKLSHIYLPRHKDNWDRIIPKGEKYRIAFAGSHSRGTIFKNGNPYITKKMEENWDKLCQKIPEFYFGRFDVRFHSMADLENARNIKIIEINGASAEATHIWDSNTSLRHAYKTLMAQYNHMFAIGAKNKRRGFKPLSLKKVRNLIKKHDDVTNRYPHTH